MIIDHRGLVRERYAAGSGAVYLIRRDQHVAGRWPLAGAGAAADGDAPQGDAPQGDAAGGVDVASVLAAWRRACAME